ncbi:MAG: hypothetical protein ACK56I_24070, partial [bacterium]
MGVRGGELHRRRRRGRPLLGGFHGEARRPPFLLTLLRHDIGRAPPAHGGGRRRRFGRRRRRRLGRPGAPTTRRTGGRGRLRLLGA